MALGRARLATSSWAALSGQSAPPLVSQSVVSVLCTTAVNRLFSAVEENCREPPPTTTHHHTHTHPDSSKCERSPSDTVLTLCLPHIALTHIHYSAWPRQGFSLSLI